MMHLGWRLVNEEIDRVLVRGLSLDLKHFQSAGVSPLRNAWLALSHIMPSKRGDSIILTR